MESNLDVRSNLMLFRDASSGDSNRFAPFPTCEEVSRETYRFLPGDLVKLLYPSYTDARNIHRYLTEKQIHEVQQYLVCVLCHRTCAGTCTGSRAS